MPCAVQRRWHCGPLAANEDRLPRGGCGGGGGAGRTLGLTKQEVKCGVGWGGGGLHEEFSMTAHWPTDAHLTPRRTPDPAVQQYSCGRKPAQEGPGAQSSLDRFGSNVKTEWLHTLRTKLNGFIRHRKRMSTKTMRAWGGEALHSPA